MIASLHGKIRALAGDRAVIDVGGIGFQVHMPASTLSTLGAAGETVELHTHLHLREDNVTLYGFAAAEELGLFETLIGVSGLGPRLALAMLSTMSAEKLAIAIATGNVEALTIIPGIGRKTANRIVLELKDRIGAGLVTAPAPLADEDTEVMAALTSLGYSVSEASRAIAAVPSDRKLSLEEKITLALQHFGGK